VRFWLWVRKSQESAGLGLRLLAKKLAGVSHVSNQKVEEQGIDPCASCMLSMRSTI
jgi:hypothetical protein